jgi:hypothetical protein
VNEGTGNISPDLDASSQEQTGNTQKNPDHALPSRIGAFSFHIRNGNGVVGNGGTGIRSHRNPWCRTVFPNTLSASQISVMGEE